MHRDKTEKRGVPLLNVKGLLSTLGYIYIVQTFVYQGHVSEEVQKNTNRVVAVGYCDTASRRKSKNVHMRQLHATLLSMLVQLGVLIA